MALYIASFFQTYKKMDINIKETEKDMELTSGRSEKHELYVFQLTQDLPLIFAVEYCRRRATYFNKRDYEEKEFYSLT